METKYKKNKKVLGILTAGVLVLTTDVRVYAGSFPAQFPLLETCRDGAVKDEKSIEAESLLSSFPLLKTLIHSTAERQESLEAENLLPDFPLLESFGNDSDGKVSSGTAESPEDAYTEPEDSEACTPAAEADLEEAVPEEAVSDAVSEDADSEDEVSEDADSEDALSESADTGVEENENNGTTVKESETEESVQPEMTEITEEAEVTENPESSTEEIPLITDDGNFPNTWTNTGNQAQDIAEIARTQIGYQEIEGQYTKYASWYYNRNLTASWNAIFVSWCADQAGISTDIIRKNASSGCNRKVVDQNPFGCPGYLFGKEIAEIGDLAFIDDNADAFSEKVGIITYADDSTITVIMGDYGDQVIEAVYYTGSGERADISGSSEVIMFIAKPEY